jgi:polysaccharide transporter, PST family
VCSVLIQAIARFRGRILLHKLIGNTAWQLVDKVLRLVTGLFVGIWVARYLGPSEYGLLNFSIAFVALFTPIGEIGLQSIVIRDLVRRPGDRARILASSLILRFAGAALAIAVCVASIALAEPKNIQSQTLILIVALSLLPQAWDVIDFDFQSSTRSRPIALIRLTSLIISSVFRLGLIYRGASLTWFAWAIVLEASFSAILMNLLLRYQRRGFPLSVAAIKEMKQLLETSWPFAIAGLSIMLYMRIDQVMLGQMLGDKAVGIFAAAVRISECWYFVPMAILASIAPALTAAYHRSEMEFQSKLVLFIRIVFILSVAMAATFTVCSKPLIGLMYGSAYAGAAEVLSIHAWAGVFVCLGVASGPWFVNSGITKIRMVHTLVGALANVTLNTYMIPRFGPVGAATSTLISYSLAAFWLNTISYRTRPIFALQARAMFLKSNPLALR